MTCDLRRCQRSRVWQVTKVQVKPIQNSSGNLLLVCQGHWPGEFQDELHGPPGFRFLDEPCLVPSLFGGGQGMPPFWDVSHGKISIRESIQFLRPAYNLSKQAYHSAAAAFFLYPLGHGQPPLRCRYASACPRMELSLVPSARSSRPFSRLSCSVAGTCHGQSDPPGQ